MYSSLITSLRGAPTSILWSLSLDGPAGRDELVARTGWSTGAVVKGIRQLELYGAIERLHHRAWRINPAWRAIPLPSATPTTAPPQLSTELSTGAPVSLSAESERSSGDPSSQSPINPSPATVPIASSLTTLEGSPGDPSPAEGSSGDLSAPGLDGDIVSNIHYQASPSNPIQQAGWPIESDQVAQADADLWAACWQLGIGQPARGLISRSATIQARGPAYLRLHVTAAARDRNRTGSAIGLAINRIYRLAPALPCGDCGRCAQCARYYPAFSAESYAAYADVIRR